MRQTKWIIFFFLLCRLFSNIQFIDPAFSPLKYCSFDNEEYVRDRSIPNRGGSNHVMNLWVKQVHILHRHGSRVPDSKLSTSCIPTLEKNPISWDCNYNEIILGDSGTVANIYQFDKESLHDPSQNDSTEIIKPNKKPILFKKSYDAKIERNDLNGNCNLGQLTSAAIPQMMHIASSIFNTYFKIEPLITLEEFVNNPSLIYFRSTDKQRTILSGTLILSNLLNLLISYYGKEPQTSLIIPTIDLHTVDLDNDELRLNSITCPEAYSIVDRLVNSPEAKTLYTKHKHLYDQWSDASNLNFSHFYKSHILDCYTSLLCSNNQDYLPEFMRVDPSNYTHSFGAAFYEAYSKEYELLYKLNDAELSKCVSKDMMKTFFGAFDAGSQNPLDYTSSRESKLLLYSAHDTTLMYFLSSLDDLFDGLWPSIASMVLFELLENDEGLHYFRVIYNGQDITNRWKGCKDDDVFINEGVCPFQYIIDQLHWINSSPITPKVDEQVAENNKETPPSVLTDFFLGIFIIFIIFAGIFIYRKTLQYLNQTNHEKVHLLKELSEISGNRNE